MKVVRRLLLACTIGCVLAAGYIATPLVTAWTIREAVKAGDSAYLERKIEWPTLRATLKESLGKFAFSTSGDMTEMPAKPTLWQKIKTYVGQGALDRFVETTVTPTGMSGLLNLRKGYQAALVGEEVKPPLLTRIGSVWSRVTRAEFQSFDRFEMDMIDKEAPERTIACVLERRGIEWKMTELRVKTTEPAKLTKLQGQTAAFVR